MYRQYIHLADLSLEYAGVITASIREDETGALGVNPDVLAGISMDQMNRLNAALKWIYRLHTHT